MAAQHLKLGDQHLFNELAAANISRVGQLVKRIDRVGVELQFDTLKPTIFIAFKLIAFIDTQLFIARKRISFRSSRSTLVREQI